MPNVHSRVVAPGAAALIPLAALLGVASPALAHDELVGSEIITDNAGAPDAVLLTYSNEIIEVGAEVVVTSPDGDDATEGELVVDGREVTRSLAADLPAGDYQGAWSVVSSDGHRIEGTFVLGINDDGSSQLEDGVILADEPESGDDASSEELNEQAGEGDYAQPPIWPVAIGAVAAIGIALAVIVGQRRRARAITEAAQNSAEGASNNAQQNNEEN